MKIQRVYTSQPQTAFAGFKFNDRHAKKVFIEQLCLENRDTADRCLNIIKENVQNPVTVVISAIKSRLGAYNVPGTGNVLADIFLGVERMIEGEPYYSLFAYAKEGRDIVSYKRSGNMLKFLSRAAEIMGYKSDATAQVQKSGGFRDYFFNKSYRKSEIETIINDLIKD